MHARGDVIRFSEDRGLDYDPVANAIFYNDYDHGRVAKLGDVGGNAWFEGRIGVGTTSPSAGLHVQNKDLLVASDRETGGSGVAQLSFSENSSGGVASVIGYDGDNENGPNNHVFIQNDGRKTAVFTHGGQVGIGTTSPSAGFHLQNRHLLISNDQETGGSGIAQLQFSEASNGEAGAASSIGYDGDNFNGPDNHLFVQNNGQKTAVFTHGGKVGIGTSSPSKKLTVKGHVLAREVIVKPDRGDGRDTVAEGRRTDPVRNRAEKAGR
jgi:hypothetical protein